MKITCFISHPWAKGFHHFAIRLAQTLRTRGIEVWIDEEKILPGDDIRIRIQNGVRHESDILLFVLSSETLQSEACIEEFEIALRVEKPIIAILIDSCKMPLKLSKLLYADFTNPIFFDASVDRLVEGIEKLSQQQRLIALLKNHDPDIRIKAAALLGELHEPKVVTAISERIRIEFDPDVKYWLAIALGRLVDLDTYEGKEALRLLKWLMTDPSPRVKQGATEALCRLQELNKTASDFTY